MRSYLEESDSYSVFVLRSRPWTDANHAIYVQVECYIQKHCTAAECRVELRDYENRWIVCSSIHDGTQGQPVCDDSWGMGDAKVACRMMGYSGVEAVLSYGYVPDDFVMDNVNCGVRR